MRHGGSGRSGERILHGTRNLRGQPPDRVRYMVICRYARLRLRILVLPGIQRIGGGVGRKATSPWL